MGAVIKMYLVAFPFSNEETWSLPRHLLKFSVGKLSYFCVLYVFIGEYNSDVFALDIDRSVFGVVATFVFLFVCQVSVPLHMLLIG